MLILDVTLSLTQQRRRLDEEAAQGCQMGQAKLRQHQWVILFHFNQMSPSKKMPKEGDKVFKIIAGSFSTKKFNIVIPQHAVDVSNNIPTVRI